MAEQIGIFHGFVSSVADDPTLPAAVRPQTQWNAGHVLTGGNDGQMLVKDSTQPFGFNFSDVKDIVSGRLVSFASANQHVLNVASPTSPLVNLNIRVNSPGSTRLLISQLTFQDSNPSIHTITFFLNVDAAVNINSISFAGAPALMPGVFITPPANNTLAGLSVGPHVVYCVLTTPNPPIVNADAYLFYLEFA